jgi:VWFA-related protein
MLPAKAEPRNLERVCAQPSARAQRGAALRRIPAPTARNTSGIKFVRASPFFSYTGSSLPPLPGMSTLTTPSRPSAINHLPQTPHRGVGVPTPRRIVRLFPVHLDHPARPAALAAALVAAAASLAAQTTPPAAAPAVGQPPATITVTSQLVNLPVVVRDKNGALVTTLTQSDFALVVDGHAQPIRYFDRDNNLPLTLGLLVDISGSVRSALPDERDASQAFLDQMVTAPTGRPPDQAFLIQFAHEVDLLQDLTPSVPKLRAALRDVGAQDQDESRNRTNSGGGYGRHGGFHGGGTTLYDAIYLASNQIMQKQQGRKAVVVLTDGEDRGSMETLGSAIAAAQRAETIVYAIYFKGEQHSGGYGHGGFGGHGYPGGGRGGEQHVDGRKVLAQITGQTGGRMFEVSGQLTFASIYSQIGEELRSQYRLGYVPNANTASDGFHRVELTLPKDKKLSVQTRDGYYAGS